MKSCYHATLTRGTATPRCVLVAPEQRQRQKRITPRALPPDAAASVLKTRTQLISAGVPEAHVDAILASFIPSNASVATKEDINELRLYMFLLLAGTLLSVTPDSPLGTMAAALWKIIKP